MALFGFSKIDPQIAWGCESPYHDGSNWLPVRPAPGGIRRTMRCRIDRAIAILSLLALCVLVAGTPARGDLVLGFPNGLTGWTTPDSSPNPAMGDPGTVTASGGQATIAESTFASETDLFLTFTVPSGVQSLQFTLNSVSPDSTVDNNNANGYLPDSFGASLLNPSTLASLVPTTDPTTDSFYTLDVVGGVTQGQAADGVTVSGGAGVLAVVSVDLSSLNLTGQTAEILFRLVGGTDPASSSTVTLSDVTVIGASSVPEPGTFILGVLGVLCVSGYQWRNRRTARGVSGILAS